MDGTVIMETTAVVLVLKSYHEIGRGPAWFERRLDGKLVVPRAVETEFKRLQKANKRGKGRNDIAWMGRVKGAEKNWIYDMYQEPGRDGGLLRRIERMHMAAVNEPGTAEARAWLKAKKARLFSAWRISAKSAEASPKPALRRLYEDAKTDRIIMMQAVMIARSLEGKAVLVSNDGDFTAFAKPLEEISGGAMRVVRFAKMR